MWTTRRRQVTEDACEPMCGLRKLDSVWTTRGDDTRARKGDQPNEPLERPAFTTKGTRSEPRLDETWHLWLNSNASHEDNDNDSDTLIEGGANTCWTSGPATVSDKVTSRRQKARESGKVVRAVGSEEFQDAREDRKTRTVHGQQLKKKRKREVTKFQAA